MISVVIPAFNQHEMTRECLSALSDHTQDCEIILVDNGSSPAYRVEFLPNWVAPGGMVIRNERNEGFPAAVNQGIRSARGDVICVLNNDVIVTPEWARMLTAHLERFAIIGPMTNYCAGIQAMTLPIYYDRKELVDRAEAWSKDRIGRSLPVNWIIGFCFAFKRSLYDAIGSFDESLWPCSGEEIDFCFRAKRAGYEVGVAQDVYVHHEGSQTFRSVMSNDDYLALVERNDKHLAERWGKSFWNEQLIQYVPGAGIRLNMGCGKFKLKGFTNIDNLPRVAPDILCDVMKVPFDAGTVDEIYAGHILEHFPFSDGVKALAYWHSLLRSGGKVSVSVPDYDAVARMYVEHPTAENLKSLNDMYLYSEHQESPHRYMYNGPLLQEVMRGAGFIDLEQMPVDHPYFPDAVEWQIGFSGIKP